MNNLILVAIGGACGSSLRYLMQELVTAYAKDYHFPFATLTVNVIGSLLMGIAYFFITNNLESISPQIRLLLTVGFLGGFTTFSAFSADAIRLFHNGQADLAFIYIIASVILSLAAMFLGFYIAQIIF
ncbi:MAG: fluoride efflux transporter CrcB [Proteobacteria bacterium]|nr:fluoride efflux transporter CrcB [Pseudomonadota bacterium]